MSRPLLCLALLALTGCELTVSTSAQRECLVRGRTHFPAHFAAILAGGCVEPVDKLIESLDFPT